MEAKRFTPELSKEAQARTQGFEFRFEGFLGFDDFLGFRMRP